MWSSINAHECVGAMDYNPSIEAFGNVYAQASKTLSNSAHWYTNKKLEAYKVSWRIDLFASGYGWLRLRLRSVALLVYLVKRLHLDVRLHMWIIHLLLRIDLGSIRYVSLLQSKIKLLIKKIIKYLFFCTMLIQLFVIIGQIYSYIKPKRDCSLSHLNRNRTTMYLLQCVRMHGGCDVCVCVCKP